MRHVWGNVTWHTDPELRPGGVVIAFSERTGGRSVAPYATLNMSDRVDDRPAAVAENRKLLMQALGLDDEAQKRLCSCIQVHGTAVARIDAQTAGRALPDTDALITATPNIPLLICVADCVPVILVARGPRRALAVVHSGWKGTLARISAVAVEALREAYGTDPADLTAYIGPYIGPDSFEVSPEVAAQFAEVFPDLPQTAACEGAGDGGSSGDSAAGSAQPTVRLDLGQAVSLTLRQSGVPADAIAILGDDTATNRAHYYSYRAQNGVTGRQAALACLLPEPEPEPEPKPEPESAAAVSGEDPHA